MKCLVSGFFLLVLEVISKLTSDIVNKSLRASKIFPKYDFEVGPCNKNSAHMTILILSSFEAYEATEK